MLALRNISSKKLAIYVSIIILALGGIGGTLYQNQKSTNTEPLASGDATENNEFIAAETDLAGGPAAPSQPLADALRIGKGLKQMFQADKIENNKEIDSTIFSSEKFKALKANTLIPREDPVLGKRDIFQPN